MIQRFQEPFPDWIDVPEHGVEPEQENSALFADVVPGSHDDVVVQQLLMYETPPVSVAVMSTLASVFPQERDVGLNKTPGAVVSAGGFTVTPIPVVRVREPDVPVTVTVFVPVVAVPGPILNTTGHVLFAAGVHDDPDGHEHARLVPSQLAGMESATDELKLFWL